MRKYSLEGGHILTLHPSPDRPVGCCAEETEGVAGATARPHLDVGASVSKFLHNLRRDVDGDASNRQSSAGMQHSEKCSASDLGEPLRRVYESGRCPESFLPGGLL